MQQYSCIELYLREYLIPLFLRKHLTGQFLLETESYGYYIHVDYHQCLLNYHAYNRHHMAIDPLDYSWMYFHERLLND